MQVEYHIASHHRSNYFITTKIAMKRSKKMPSEAEQSTEGSVLPYLNAAQFSSQVNSLLDRVSVQNRYATRISQCNMKNMQELQKARRQLQSIAQQKKLTQLRVSSERDFLEQMTRRASSSEEQLKNVFKELIEARREIKGLKKEIKSLENINLGLEKQILQFKREKIYQISAVKEQLEKNMMTSEVKKFLYTSTKTNSILYRHCLEAFKDNQFTNFLENLEKKLREGRLKIERECSVMSNKSHDPFRLVRQPSHLKLQPLKQRFERMKTQHIDNSFPLV